MCPRIPSVFLKKVLVLSSMAFFWGAACGLCQITNTNLWQVSLPGGVFSSPVIAQDGTIYVVAIAGSPTAWGTSAPDWLCSISPQGLTNWTRGFPRGIHGAPAIAPDGTVYVGCENGLIYGLVPDGTTNRILRTGGQIITSPAIGADGTVYVASITNNFNALYGFK